MSRRGFTLIELIVVIALVAILAAILFPTFATAREDARTATCKSNLRQLAMAAQQYASDYDEFLFPVQTCNGPVLPTGQPARFVPPNCRMHDWPALLWPYARSIDVFNCPNNSYRWHGESTSKASYGYNFLPAMYSPVSAGVGGGCEMDCGIDLNFGSLAGISDPSHTILFCESSNVMAGPGDGSRAPALWVRNCGGADRRRHGDRLVCGFVDGHVASYPFEHVIFQRTYALWTTSAD